jgi:hypothetical protein
MANTTIFPPSFLLLQQEGYLISSCLCIGLTELRAANVQNKGAFYSSLLNLSTGFERLLKAIIIIDHMLKNNLSVPTKKQLQAYGHNITELYDTCEKIATNRETLLPSRTQLNEINQELLSLLSDFARTTRYHNLDALSSSHNGMDPLAHWGQIIFSILNQDVTQNQKQKIFTKANIVVSAIDDISITLMHGLDKQPLSTLEAFSLPGLHEQAVKFAVLRLINILTPIRNLISLISHEAYKLGLPAPPFPQMQEFLSWLWDDRQYVLRKKKWP